MIYQGCKLTVLQVEIYQICLSLKSLKHSSTSMAQTKTYSLRVTSSKPESIFTYNFSISALELRYQGLQIRLTCVAHSHPSQTGNEIFGSWSSWTVRTVDPHKMICTQSQACQRAGLFFHTHRHTHSMAFNRAPHESCLCTSDWRYYHDYIHINIK